ncbi:hypothetical protein FA10DRAFT_300268 [Acaromyces ingoldii]|uniref:Uncharacterized protein n=1 Tax=Acaromyces ingoldii TaxID=215250 RepID=A0A316YRP4_9BASI|nr:hypothetical protein FA10DRAFT_300268 [Acaromyces ingoldii]PWN91676.1 hypothetical protein FA10DRAFT_300268 [Acaromyces ingoldii]
MSAVYSIYTSPNHAPIPNHLPTLIVTPHGQPHHTLYSYIHTSFNRETYLLTPSPQGDLCVAKMVPPPGSRGPGGPGQSDPGHASDPNRDRSVRCEASRNLKWSITNTGIHAPVYKLTLPNPDAPGHEQPLFQISKPNPNATFWTMFYFTYAGHLIPPKRIEFGKIQKNASVGSGGGGGTRVSITGKSPEEKAVWQTLGEGNEDMVEWIVLCAALNLLDEEIIKAAEKGGSAVAGARNPNAQAVPSSRPGGIAGAAPPGRGQQPPMQIRQMPGPQPQPFQRPPPPAGYMNGGGGGGGGGGTPPAGYGPPPAGYAPQGGRYPPGMPPQGQMPMQRPPPGAYGPPPGQMRMPPPHHQQQQQMNSRRI